ncbi:MAG: hypothetical protein HZB24_13020 [Desulfobacterales bacterium]|nr:hypothetical protein [Desulfomonile tiedjei]MBI5896874.1 hypothetical protein [Desulfobacterales bacterium]
MDIDTSVVDKAGETEEESKASGKSTGFENVKITIAEKLRHAAEVIGEKAADQDAQSGLAQHGKLASEWLNHSAEYVRQFDYAQVDARVREFVRQSPGRSILIAGGIGLILGAILRRR